MGDIIVMGGGPVGLATAMLLARDGYQVTVLEKDAHPIPPTGSEAWEAWERKGVAQFRAAHYMQAKFRHVLDAELPDVRDELERSGANRHSVVGGFGHTITDPTPRPGDERFETLTARRPVIDSAFARVAESTPGVEVMRGVAVEGVITNGSGANGIPRVVGVRTTDGEEMRAGLVVDAMGRRSRIVDLIKGIGGRPPYEEAADAGFTYYTRHYRGSRPEVRGTYFTLLSSFAVISAPTDADTWLIAVVCSSGDKALKALRHAESWERVVRSVDHIAHWLDGESVQDISPMAGVLDRYRRFVVDGQPVVTGLVAVGDAWACTNPQAGRGVSTGLRHAVALRNVVRDTPDDPRAIAEAFDLITEETCAPWYRMQVVRDSIRYESVHAAIEGRELPAPTDPAIQMQNTFNIAAAHDPDVARLGLEVFGCLALPEEILSRPGVVDKVLAAAEGREPPPLPGPSRAELLELLSA